MKPFIYLASPYTKGDPCINTNFQMRMFKRFVADGVVDAYIPLWSHFQHSAFPEPYTTWINYDLAIIPRLDGVLRLNAHIPELNYFEDKSSGADGEVKFAQDHKLPTWFSVPDLYRWALERAHKMVASKEEFLDKYLHPVTVQESLEKDLAALRAYRGRINTALDEAIAEADVFGKPMVV